MSNQRWYYEDFSQFVNSFDPDFAHFWLKWILETPQNVVHIHLKYLVSFLNIGHVLGKTKCIGTKIRDFRLN